MVRVIHSLFLRWRAIMAYISILGMGTSLAACGGSSREPPAVVDTPAVEQVQPPGATAAPLPEVQEPDEPPQVTEEVEPPEAIDIVETSEVSDAYQEPVGGDIDACTLVTKDEVEAVLGMPVGELVSENYDGLYLCTYELGEDASVDISVTAHDDEEGAAYWFQWSTDSEADEVTGYGPVEISGFGYPAYEFYLIINIVVLIGRYELTIDVIDYLSRDRDAEFKLARELVEIALSGMP